MFRKFLFMVLALSLCLPTMCNAQKKEISKAKDNVKAGKSLEEAETSMRKLLTDSANKDNEKIWLILFDAVRKQYETVNEQMYLKQKADTSKLFLAAYRMFGVLEGLDSVEWNLKGVQPAKMKYRKRHAEYLNQLRGNLYNGGLFFVGKNDYKNAYSLFAAYIDCAKQPIFAAYDYQNNDKRIGTAAFYTVYCGYKQNDAERTLTYADVAQQDTIRLIMTYQYMAETYRQKADTTKFVEVLESGFARYPQSKYFFSHLFDHYYKQSKYDVAIALCDDAIEADTSSVVALFAKSTVLLAQQKYNDCVSICDKVIEKDKNFADVYLNAGLAYFNQATYIERTMRHSREKTQKLKALFKKALPYMQEYRKLAPNEKAQWGVPLYTIYLNLNMGREFEEIDKLMKK